MTGMDKFEEHHNEEDIMKLNMRANLAKWKDELEFNNEELSFYIELLNPNSGKITGSGGEDAEYLYRELKELRKENTFHTGTLVGFRLKMEGMEECDDVQCENYYLEDHLVLKATLEKHFRHYRILKKKMFEVLRNDFTSSLDHI